MSTLEEKRHIIDLGRLEKYAYEIVSRDTTENRQLPLANIERQQIIITIPDPEGTLNQEIEQATEAGKQILFTARVHGYREPQLGNYKGSLRGEREFEPGVLSQYMVIYFDLMLKRLKDSL